MHTLEKTKALLKYPYMHVSNLPHCPGEKTILKIIKHLASVDPLKISRTLFLQPVHNSSYKPLKVLLKTFHII